MRPLKLPLRPELGRFLCVGGTCFTLNLVILYLLVERLAVHYLVAVAFSILVTNALGFVLNRNWTFVSRTASWWRELLRYLTVNLGQFALNFGLMGLLVSGIGVSYLVASALIAVVMTGANFLLHKNWSFAAK